MELLMPAVLVLGLDPEFVSPERMGGFSPAVVRAYLDAQMDRIRGLGHEVETCLVDFGETAETVLTNQLRKRSFDCVMIGAGVRAEEQLLLFEKLLNVVHGLAPGAKICFNTSPADSVEAVQRWL
jgi:hypothetical protein